MEIKEVAKAEECLKTKQENPLTPEENILGLFRFEVHEIGWQPDGTWECTAPLDHLLWWRKRV